MKNRKVSLLVISSLLPLTGLIGCGSKTSSGFTKVDYSVSSRDRYNNIFRENIPEQWENYGIGDPFLLRWNGEYYLYVSTKDNNPGFKLWKSNNLVNFTYLGHYDYVDSEGHVLTTNHLGQYAPEVYCWNGEIYMYGSPSGNGHYVYKSVNGRPDSNFEVVTNNFGLSIDGSVFIDDDETMTFLTAGNGAIQAYEMRSMTEMDPSTQTSLLSPLINWTEGPCIVKHDSTYFLTYTGNHVKSKGYRVDYSYSNESPMSGFIYPANNSIALKTLSNQNGLGHSSTVLGPNLDSYYMSYHSLDDASGPIRSYNINRLSFSDNRMTMYGPKEKESLVPVLPDFVSYSSEDKMTVEGDYLLSNNETEDRFSAEYNIFSFSDESKLVFGYKGESSNFISISNKKINLYLNNTLVESGNLINDFDFNKIHTIRLHVDNGHYRVYFDNMMKIDVLNKDVIEGGKIGYFKVSNVGTTTFANDAFDSSDRVDPKFVNGDFFASKYLSESKLTAGKSYPYVIEDTDGIDYDNIYNEASAVKLGKPGDYLLYPIDVEETYRYGVELLHAQNNKGAVLSLQIDNNEPTLFEFNETDFSENMNSFEDQLLFRKDFVCETKIEKGLHTLKIELVKGSADISYVNFFKDSDYSPDYSNDLSQYVDKGASYLSLWKIIEDGDTTVHKAKAGVNNMILFGNETLTDYEVSVDIKVSVSSATNSMAGLIVRCNNPSLYSGYIDQSAQGYLIAFNRLQLKQQRINYNSTTVAVDTTANTYTLGDWHNIKVVCKGNKTTTYFDNVLRFSYADPYPFSHGLVALYSINAESFYKNLSIKGI